MDEITIIKTDVRGEHWFIQRQYEILVRCSERRDLTEWNVWRLENRHEKVHLAEAQLKGMYLRGANFREADFFKANFSGSTMDGCNLEEADLYGADLRGVHIEGSRMKFARLDSAKLGGSRLGRSNFEGATFIEADLQDAFLTVEDMGQTSMRGIGYEVDALSAEHFYITGCNLRNTDFSGANMENANLTESILGGMHLESANLKGAKFSKALVDGSTLIWNCTVDRNTDVSGVGMDCIRIDSGTKYLLKYNVRRKNWEAWYKEHPCLKLFVRGFWFLSDYGISTSRIIGIFFISALLFAMLYYFCAMVWPPGLVHELLETSDFGPVPRWLVPVRAIYFSIITMATLGFGDIHANPQILWGYIVLSVQALLGYVLFAALVTRAANMFMSEGPKGKFG